MLLTNVIDFPLWDKAGWKGTVFGFGPDGTGLPFMGPLFLDDEAGKEIFQQWRKYLSEADIHELIQVSIIEGDIPGEQEGYTVYIGTNAQAALGLASIRKPESSQSPLMITARFNRMTPAKNSINLSDFRERYHWCPVISRIISTGYNLRPLHLRNDVSKRPVK